MKKKDFLSGIFLRHIKIIIQNINWHTSMDNGEHPSYNQIQVAKKNPINWLYTKMPHKASHPNHKIWRRNEIFDSQTDSNIKQVENCRLSIPNEMNRSVQLFSFSGATVEDD